MVTARLRAAGCVFAEEEARLLLAAASSDEELDDLVARRAAGTPLEYLLGRVEFGGIRVGVRPGVFVPRQRTVFLVEEAASLLRGRSDRPTVVDLCCGSGALGLALLHTLARPMELVASDIDPVAVACARDNLVAIGARVYRGDLFDALPDELRGRVDVLLANTPYVPTRRITQLPVEARDHEPAIALDGGSDGLDVFRRVAAGAGAWLRPGGHVLIEVGVDQTAAAAAVLSEHGLAARMVHSPELEATVAIGRSE
ncbi:putative protein N(5)-glutamine methyltransferase [Nocardia paucivorans]|uniref:putative protein N(5)-glutamine methyltransferase n=1 Tax=Nocardia paucivorans TaxID=114259 RepID=UPI0005926C11|nr:putative protein N(5)-glutamine methyltransferase [Nocardia paucivorans]